MRKPKRQSAPPIVISNDSLNARSDDESSFLTAPTVSTKNEFSDHSGDAAVRYPSQRFSGGESDGEEPCPPEADPRQRFSEARRSSSGGEASAAVSEPVVPSDVKPASLRQRSSSDTQTSHTHVHDGKFQSSAKRAVQSMRNLVSTPKPSLEASEWCASLRDLLAETHSNAAALSHDSCSRSEQTIDSSKIKVTSNVSDHNKYSFDRGRSYPSKFN